MTHLQQALAKTDALAAVIAYFTLLAPEWLARSPERLVRCRSELTKIILTIRGRGARTYHDSGDTNAEAFSAEALPAYWAERPEDGERCGYRLEGLWEHLLGMDSVVAGVWGDENEALLGRMSSHYERWAKAWLGSRCGGTGLVNLLKRPPARLLLLSGLEWLLPVWEKADFARYGRGHEERAYADFLAFLWNERWSDIKTRPAALHSFREIANKLAAAQNTLALEITARIAAGSAGER